MGTLTLSSRAAQTARDLAVAISACLRFQDVNTEVTTNFTEVYLGLQLRGPSSSARLGMTAGALEYKCNRHEHRNF